MSAEYLDLNPGDNDRRAANRPNIKRDMSMIAMMMIHHDFEGAVMNKTEVVTVFDNPDDGNGIMAVAETIIPMPDKIAENMVDFTVKEFSNAGKFAAGIADGDVEAALNNATSLVGEAVLTVDHESAETLAASRLSADAKQRILDQSNPPELKSKYTLAA